MIALLSNARIPFHVEMRRLYRNNAALHHQVSFGVVGVDKPAAVVVASRGFQSPVIVERVGRGGLRLPDRLIESLAMHCYSLLSELIIDHGGESGWRTFANARTWVRQGFSPADAKLILMELSRHVRPELTVRSACLVADDDAI